MATEAESRGHTQRDAALRLSATVTLVGAAEAEGPRGDLCEPFLTGNTHLCGLGRSSFDEGPALMKTSSQDRLPRVWPLL